MLDLCVFIVNNRSSDMASKQTLSAWPVALAAILYFGCLIVEWIIL